MIIQQWHAATTTRQLHTRVSIGLELLRDIQFGFPAILNNSLASYLPVSSDNNYVRHECINVTGSGRDKLKTFGCASCARGWTPISKFLDPPQSCMQPNNFPVYLFNCVKPAGPCRRDYSVTAVFTVSSFLYLSTSMYCLYLTFMIFSVMRHSFHITL